MTGRTRRLLLGVALLGLLVAGGFALRDLLFEKTTVSVERGFRGEATYNPYFALRELYTGLGAPSETVAGVRTLPPPGHALILATDSRPLVPKELRGLLDWVRAGGHLVVPATHAAVADPVLDVAGVGLFGEDEDDGDDAESRSDFRTQRTTWPKLYDLGTRTLVRSDGPDDAAWALSVELGDGQVTVSVDLRPFINGALGEEQHADLAWWLVRDRDGRPPAGVWIVHRQAPVSVWTLLVQRGRPVALAVGLICLVGLALVARPFGPKLEAPPRDRRHLTEHLRATGRYLWDRGVEHALLRAVQSGVRRRLARGGEPTERQLVELVRQDCARTGDDPERIHAALTLRGIRDPHRFTETIKTLEALRRNKT
ncbi:MAG: DUF4350 domain-containing protein [Acidobacteriota bacterium]